MLGLEACLLIYVTLGVQEAEGYKYYCTYVTDVKTRLQSAYNTASETFKKAQTTQTSNFKMKAMTGTIKTRDKVPVKQLAFEGR